MFVLESVLLFFFGLNDVIGGFAGGTSKAGYCWLPGSKYILVVRSC